MIWQGFPEFFITVSYNDQRRIHDYYRPHLELTEEQLDEHQAKISTERPSLPASAGRAFKRLEAIYRLTSKHAKGDPVLWRAILRQHQHGVTGLGSTTG